MIPTTIKQETPAPALQAREPGERVGAMSNPSTGGIVPNAPVIVKCNLDNKPMSRKPDKAEYGKMRYRMYPKTLDARQLFGDALNGYAFTPAALSGTGGNSWMEQRIFAVDVDNHPGDENPLTVDAAWDAMEANGVNPLFSYYTFSHSDAVPRFRIVFATDETVTDKVDAEHITAALQSLFPNADKAAVDAARVFLGTDKGVAIPYTGLTNPVSHLLELYHDRVEAKQTTIPPTHNAKPVSDSDLARAIEEFDMGGYVSTTEGIQGKWRSGRLMFNPCPICGHNDDFYTQGSTWKCFGANGPGHGGNIINYLEAKHGFPREQAREHLMYNILGWNREETRKQSREAERVKQAERVTGAAAITDKAQRPDFIRVKKRKDPETGELVEVESVDCPRLAQYIRERSNFKFVKIPGAKSPVRFWYRDGVYQEVWEDEIMGEIMDIIDAWNPELVKMRDVEEVYKFIKRKPGKDRFVDFEAKDAEELVVNFRNGLFYPMTWELKPHTPDIFTTRQLPIDFPLDALDNRQMIVIEDNTPNFQKYMERFCYRPGMPHEDGNSRFNCLMEYMAVVLSNIKSEHVKKSLWMYGDGNSGKSQLLALLQFLLGQNAHCTDLEQLEARFGTGAVFNKRLVYCPDQKFIKVKELGVFKQLVGAGDSVNVERKGRDAFTYKFDGFMWVCANKLPKFGGDNGVHVYERMIPFKTPDTIPAEERDGQLLNKMKAEAPYIVALILGYLPLVVNRGYKITEPLEAAQARKEYAFENDPVRQWLAECCIEVQNPADDMESETVERWRAAKKPIAKSMYKVYCAWCAECENGYKLKWNDWENELKAILGCPDMLDAPDPKQPDKPALYLPRLNAGMVIAHWCLNNYALSEYSAYL